MQTKSARALATITTFLCVMCFGASLIALTIEVINAIGGEAENHFVVAGGCLFFAALFAGLTVAAFLHHKESLVSPPSDQ
jgi:hypothetical protein